MTTRHRRADDVVGLDIGASAVRGVQLRRRKDGTLTVRRAATVDLPRGAVAAGEIVAPQAVVSALRRLWRRGRFSTRKVVLGLADTHVLTRQVELPWMPPDDFRAALRYQVGDALPVDLSTVELDYHLLEEVERVDDHGQPAVVNRILIVATRTTFVAALADVARKARLQPVVADTTAFALIRAACAGQVPDDDRVHAVVDLGADQLTVAVHRRGQPRFIRAVGGLGGEAATAAMSERLRVDPDEAERIKRDCGLNGPAPVVVPIAESSVFAHASAPTAPALSPRDAAAVDILAGWATRVISEVRNSLDYFHAHQDDAQVSSVTLSGRTAALDGLVDRLAMQLQVPVLPAPALAGLSAARGVARKHGDDRGLVVAAGLAMSA